MENGSRIAYVPLMSIEEYNIKSVRIIKKIELKKNLNFVCNTAQKNVYRKQKIIWEIQYTKQSTIIKIC